MRPTTNGPTLKWSNGCSRDDRLAAAAGRAPFASVVHTSRRIAPPPVSFQRHLNPNRRLKALIRPAAPLRRGKSSRLATNSAISPRLTRNQIAPERRHAASALRGQHGRHGRPAGYCWPDRPRRRIAVRFSDFACSPRCRAACGRSCRQGHRIPTNGIDWSARLSAARRADTSLQDRRPLVMWTDRRLYCGLSLVLGRRLSVAMTIGAAPCRCCAAIPYALARPACEAAGRGLVFGISVVVRRTVDRAADVFSSFSAWAIKASSGLHDRSCRAMGDTILPIRMDRDPPVNRAIF